MLVVCFPKLLNKAVPAKVFLLDCQVLSRSLLGDFGIQPTQREPLNFE
jgi:hypothetical protein